MLQTNLIFGIQKKIKESKQAHDTSIPGVLEEGETIAEEQETKKEILVENFYNPGLVSGVYDKVESSKKKEEHRSSLVTESFHLRKAKRKLEKDIMYFNYLFESFVDEPFKEDFQTLLESIFEDTIKLYQETDVTPRVISPAIDSNELNENQIVDLYKNSLNKAIKDNYTKPLLSGKINELYESEIRTLTKKLLEEGITADVDQVKVYLPFEETLYRFNRSILIPETANSRIESFMESTGDAYLDLFEESISDVIKSIEQKVKLLTSLVSPKMFGAAVDAEGVNAPKMAGISITVDKNFDGDGDCDEDDICPAEVAAMDPEAAEEIAAEDEAEDLEAATEDIVGAEEEAKESVGDATDVEDYEDGSLEDKAELSPAEASGEEPGAIDADLPLETSSSDKSGYPTNSSDVGLQGQGNDNGVDTAAEAATLPSSTDTSNSTEDGEIEITDEEVDSEATPDEATGEGKQTGPVNNSDKSISDGSARDGDEDDIEDLDDKEELEDDTLPTPRL